MELVSKGGKHDPEYPAVWAKDGMKDGSGDYPHYDGMLSNICV